MKVALITGSAGLVGSESVKFLADKFDVLIGIDNDMRANFFGKEASTIWNRNHLINKIPNYDHHEKDICDFFALEPVFKHHGNNIQLIIHAAAQPSHDWAATNPITDFHVNALGTLNLLELYRKYCPDAVFVFTSTNKVYGDKPNFLPLMELNKRWELDPNHPYSTYGIDESMGIDRTMHSVFGVSKTSADLMVQEYGRYYGLKTGVFRAGCITGPNHSGTMLHGFLNYLVKCAVLGDKYIIFGYKGKQVRDNIHSYDLVNMFWHFYQKPREGAVYNASGGRETSCSIIEAIEYAEKITGSKMNVSYSDNHRLGDHQWYIGSVAKFSADYPEWKPRHDLLSILNEINSAITNRFAS